METEKAIQMLSALAQEARLNIFRQLTQHAPSGLAPGTLTETLGIPSATLSFHLKEMKNAGIIQCRRDGRSLIYSPDFDVITGLLTFLSQNCCQKNPSC